jgi:prepilin-type N-terminal cleavage/methylation domain-containing protein
MKARGAAGFTLIELLVALGMSAFVIAGAGVAFQLGAQTLRGGTDQVDAQHNARWAIERMIQEIRGAGYSPTANPPTYPFDAIASPASTGLTIQNDYNGNGVIDAAGGCDLTATPERVSYRQVDTRLRRSTNPPTYSCEGSIVHGVENLSFTYLDADGNAIANPAGAPATIRTVVISLTLESLSGGAGRQVTVTDRVRIRNR